MLTVDCRAPALIANALHYIGRDTLTDEIRAPRPFYRTHCKIDLLLLLCDI